jgi:hypothetical protein
LRHSYLIQDSIVYLTIADKSYPRKLAFSYLSELSTEFNRSYPPEQALKPGLRPYAFVKFDTFIQRTKRLYLDPRGAEASGKGGQSQVGNGLDQLNEDLRDVTQIMTKNMEDLLWRGDSLDRMSTMSSSLRDESLKSVVLPSLFCPSSADALFRRYRKAAKKINTSVSLSPLFLFPPFWPFPLPKQRRSDQEVGAGRCSWSLLLRLPLVRLSSRSSPLPVLSMLTFLPPPLSSFLTAIVSVRPLPTSAFPFSHDILTLFYVAGWSAWPCCTAVVMA